MINFKRDLRQFKSKAKNLKKSIGRNGIQMFKVNNFEAQGFIDKSLTKWKPKQKPDDRKTLVGVTTQLRNTIFYNVEGNDINFGTEAEYGRYHNEGTGRGKIKRQFMGNSAALNKINQKEISKFIKKILEG